MTDIQNISQGQSVGHTPEVSEVPIAEIITLPDVISETEVFLEHVWGHFPQVTTTPTWTPKTFKDSLAINTAAGVLYYYDFTNNVWKATQNLTAPAGAIVGTTDTQTLSNKRNVKRVLSITSSATPTIVSDNYDCVDITALATAITSMSQNLSGTPNNFDTLIFRILDNGVAQSITWGTSFIARGIALPTTTVAGKRLTVGFIYDVKWGCVAVQQE